MGKVNRLSDESEPDIDQTTRRFGTILQNVAVDPAVRRLDLDQATTENTRAAYPLSHIDNVVEGSMAGHPEHPWPPSPRS